MNQTKVPQNPILTKQLFKGATDTFHPFLLTKPPVHTYTAIGYWLDLLHFTTMSSYQKQR